MAMTAKILVGGATRTNEQELVKQLISMAMSVRALVRSSDKARLYGFDDVEVLRGSKSA